MAGKPQKSVVRLLTLALALFILTWPLEKRHLFFTEYSFVTGTYTEAGTMALYASDLAFFLVIGLWLWWRKGQRRRIIAVPENVPVGTFYARDANEVLENVPAGTFSINYVPDVPNVPKVPGNVPAGTFSVNDVPDVPEDPKTPENVPAGTFSSRTLMVFAVAFCIWALIRALPLHPSFLGWYAAARVVQGFLVFLVTRDVWSTAYLRRPILFSLILAGIFQSLLGGAQVFSGSDLGFRLLGEHRLSVWEPGVAKVELQSEKSSGRFLSTNVPVGTFYARDANEVIENVPAGTFYAPDTDVVLENVPAGTFSVNDVPDTTNALKVPGNVPAGTNVPVGTIDSRSVQLGQQNVPAGTFYARDANVVLENVPVGTINPRSVSLGQQNVPAGTISTVTTRIIRAYGTFQHPNVLGSFLLLSIVATFLLVSLDKMRSIWWHEFYSVSAAIVTAGIFLTFSRSVWIALCLVIVWVISHAKISSITKESLAFFVPSVLVVTALLVSPTLRHAAQSRLLPPKKDMFLEGRLQSYRDSQDLAARDIGNILFGVGSGNLLPELVKNIKNVEDVELAREPWEFQPPHSFPLVVLLELGIVGLGLLGYVVYAVFSRWIRWRSSLNSSLKDRRSFWVGSVALGLGVAILLLTDHYHWTTQQGRIVFWGVLGALASAPSSLARSTGSPLQSGREAKVF